jgi:sulfate adenylyltransferase subunit 1
VLTRNAELKTVKEFEASLLWMDSQKLIPGNDYWLTKNRRKISANTAR